MGRRPRVCVRRRALRVVQCPEPERRYPPLAAHRCDRRWPRSTRRCSGGTRPRSPVSVGAGHDDGLRSHVECHTPGNCTGLALGDPHERTRLHRGRTRCIPGLAGRRLLPRRQALLASHIVRRLCRNCGDLFGRRLLLRTARLPPGGAAHSASLRPRLWRIDQHRDLCSVQPQLRLDGHPVFRARGVGGLLHPHPRRPGRLRNPVRAVRAHPAERHRARTRVHPGLPGRPTPPVPRRETRHGAGGARSSRSQAPGGGDPRGAGPRTRRSILCRARVLDRADRTAVSQRQCGP